MKLVDFDYQLPEDLIAQKPSPRRDQSRMMIVHRATGAIEHTLFHNLPLYLQGSDALVINNSRVIPARLWGKKATGGRVEVLLLACKDLIHAYRQVWEALLRPAKHLKPGMILQFTDGCTVTIVEQISEKKWLLDFTTALPFDEFLERQGVSPLPPYIKRSGDCLLSSEDRERYQTIYARHPGSVAAPTAGLHFSSEVMTALRDRGIAIAQVTLHVGYGTFHPVDAAKVEDHRMEEEHFTITEEAAETINGAQRVVAVGTTSTRTLEGAADEYGRVPAGKGATGLFIYPGYRFKRVGALLTNFHLPKSTLYLLVCAFAGQEVIRESYEKAIEERYRFYSYGDCMLIL